jgi:hypothetical protein
MKRLVLVRYKNTFRCAESISINAHFWTKSIRSVFIFYQLFNHNFLSHYRLENHDRFRPSIGFKSMPKTEIFKLQYFSWSMDLQPAFKTSKTRTFLLCFGYIQRMYTLKIVKKKNAFSNSLFTSHIWYWIVKVRFLKQKMLSIKKRECLNALHAFYRGLIQCNKD